MWTEAHRARHEPRLKAVVAACAVEEITRRLEDGDPGSVRGGGGNSLSV